LYFYNIFNRVKIILIFYSLFQTKISDDRLLTLCMGINEDLTIVNIIINIRALQDMNV